MRYSAWIVSATSPRTCRPSRRRSSAGRAISMWPPRRLLLEGGAPADARGGVGKTRLAIAVFEPVLPAATFVASLLAASPGR